MKTSLFLLLLLSIVKSASAQDFSNCKHPPLKGSTNLLQINAEAYPKECYYIDVAGNSAHQITSIIYRDPYSTDAKRKSGLFFSLNDLQKKTVLISATRGEKTYNIVTLLVTDIMDGGKTLKMELTYTTIVPLNFHSTREFTVTYNEHLQKYEVLDKNDRAVNSAYVKSRFWGKNDDNTPRMVGIKDLITNRL